MAVAGDMTLGEGGMIEVPPLRSRRFPDREYGLLRRVDTRILDHAYIRTAVGNTALILLVGRGSNEADRHPRDIRLSLFLGGSLLAITANMGNALAEPSSVELDDPYARAIDLPPADELRVLFREVDAATSGPDLDVIHQVNLAEWERLGRAQNISPGLAAQKYLELAAQAHSL